MPVPDVGTSKGTVDPPAFNDIDVTVPQTRGIAWPSLERNFKSLGWTEHILPDGSLYYSHRELDVATDIDLRNLKKLDAVSDYLDKKRPGEVVLPPLGWELWLRDNSKLPFDFVPAKYWVNHRDRMLTREVPTQPIGGSAPPLSEDDRKCLSALTTNDSLHGWTRLGYGVPILDICRRSSRPRTPCSQCICRGYGCFDVVLHGYVHHSDVDLFH